MPDTLDGQVPETTKGTTYPKSHLGTINSLEETRSFFARGIYLLVGGVSKTIGSPMGRNNVKVIKFNQKRLSFTRWTSYFENPL